MADLATAYVRLIPSLRGAQGAIEKELGGIGDKAGTKAGKGLGEGILGNIGEVAGKAAGIFAKVFAAKKLFDFGKASFDAYAEFEQLAGGAEKIFDQLDQKKILEDANGAWLTLNMSANDYLSSINSVGATFAQTMGDKAGYETAKRGMQAISDFASGTGADLGTLNEKYKLITRSSGSYQSIADQFAGILPQTSKDFLEQAKAAGYLKDGYEELTDVPVAEYQQAVTSMLEKGVADIGMSGNTAKESLSTLSGSMAATRTAWQNLVTEMGKDDADIGARISDMLTALLGKGGEGGMIRNVAAEVGTIARNVIGGIGTAIGMGFEWLVANGPTMALDAVKGIIDAMTNAASAIGTFDISTVFAAGEGVGQKVADLVSDIAEIIREWAPDIMSAADTLLSAVGTAITTNWPLIMAKLGEIWANVSVWLSEMLPQVVSTVGNILASVVNFVVAHREQILAAIGAGIQSIISTIVTYGPTILANVATAVGMLAGYLVGAAGELILGLVNSLVEHKQEVLDFFMNLPSAILDALGDLSGVLVDAGANLIQGFWNGLTDKFEGVKTWVTTIGGWIKDHKGPKQYDLELLVDNGGWIMTGLQKGLTDSLPELKSTLALVTDEIAGGIGLPSPSGMDLARNSMSNAVRDAYSASVPMASKAPQAAVAQPVDGGAYAATQALRDDLANMGVWLDGNALVGGIRTRMDRALVR